MASTPLTTASGPAYTSAARNRCRLVGSALLSRMTPGSSRCHGPDGRHLVDIAYVVTPAVRSWAALMIPSGTVCGRSATLG
jgi:hypothetical protein